MVEKNLAKKKVLFVVYMFFLAFLIILLIYPFFHELGHLMSAKFFGGKINGMKLGFLQAKAFFQGTFNSFQSAIIHISGFALPFIIWLVFILIVPKKAHPLFESFKILFSGAVIGSMLAWIVIPILFEYKKAPIGEDVTKFMEEINVSGFWISGIFLIIFLFSIFLFMKKLGDIKDIFK